MVCLSRGWLTFIPPHERASQFLWSRSLIQYYLSADGGPNAPPQIKSLLGNVQIISFVVHVWTGACCTTFFLSVCLLARTRTYKCWKHVSHLSKDGGEGVAVLVMDFFFLAPSTVGGPVHVLLYSMQCECLAQARVVNRVVAFGFFKTTLLLYSNNACPGMDLLLARSFSKPIFVWGIDCGPPTICCTTVSGAARSTRISPLTPSNLQTTTTTTTTTTT